tara:strand:+ start:1004 stop:1861 length:858 start_codon:yes stop_codon:yes gene_type:complete
MKLNYKDILDNKLSINSYIWPNHKKPFEFIETILKAEINNVGLHTDFIENYGVNKLKQELLLNNINVTSINSVGYFTDPFYFNQNEKILNYAKILNPDLICVITGGILGGPNPISEEIKRKNSYLDIKNIREETLLKLKILFSQAAKLNLNLGIEPIGSWEILKKGHYNSISSCQKLIKNSNHKLIVDLYHSFEDIDLDKFLKRSPSLGLLQFSNISFDQNSRPIGRKTINSRNNIHNIDIPKYLKILFNRRDNLKIEFEVFQSDVHENPKDIILNLKKELLKIL